MPLKDQDFISVPVSWISLEEGPDALYDFWCPDCGDELNVHQPDRNSPGRLVGTCADCGRWSLIESHPDEGWAAFATFPAIAMSRPWGPVEPAAESPTRAQIADAAWYRLWKPDETAELGSIVLPDFGTLN